MKLPPHILELQLVIAVFIGFKVVSGKCQEVESVVSIPGAGDCLDIQRYGYGGNGVFRISVGGKNVTVYCMSGWTVLMRRTDGRENFQRLWHEYTTGFGDIMADHWLGLENMHTILQQRSFRIREEYVGSMAFLRGDQLHDYINRVLWVEHGWASLSGKEHNYELSVAEAVSNFDLSHSLSYQNGSQFSTFDRDNDASEKLHCARDGWPETPVITGGWWYRDCGPSPTNLHYSWACNPSSPICALYHDSATTETSNLELYLKSALVLVKPLS